MSKYEDLIKEVSRLSVEEQWSLVSHVVNERVGDAPSQEVALGGNGEEPKVYLVPARLWYEQRMLVQDLQEKHLSPITVDMRHIRKILAEGGDPKETAEQIENLRPRSR